MIELRLVEKVYNSDGISTKALSGINLKIDKGDYVAIVGTSGAGKSTLLHILGGMDKVSKGEYLFDDLEVHNFSENKLQKFRRDKVSFVFQDFALLQYYTVFQNVEMPLLSKGISKKKREQIVMENLKLVGIEELAYKLPTHISGGQQQRCAIARALASGNELILADEPTGSLDGKTSEEIMEVFKRVNDMGKTIVLITHDMNVANRTKRILKIIDGKISE